MARARGRAGSALLAVLLLLPALAPAQRPPRRASPEARQVSVLIRGGTVLDGTGRRGRITDVVVRDDRIVYVGDTRGLGLVPERTIDARGLVVAPGFVDPHTHALEDLASDARRGLAHQLLQGVTTVVTGNDGQGPIDVAGVLASWDAGLGTNAAVLVGHGTVRRHVMGMSDAAPTPAQLDSMRALVLRAMREGAVGLSSGLFYAPGSFAATEELIELARAAGAAGGVYDSHLRDESSYTIGLLAAVREALRIGREASIPVNVSHVKALGEDVRGRSDSVIAIVRAARAAGQAVTADQYPYEASGSSIGASLLPRWAEAGGRDSLRARLGDPATRARLVRAMEENLRRRGGPSALLITGGRAVARRGRTLAQAADSSGRTPVEEAIAIVLDGDAAVASFTMHERDIVAFMREPWVMTGSDGSSGHPRKYGSFARLLHRYVRERGVLSLPAAVARSSGLPARTFRLVQRGLVREGYYADLVVFAPREVRDHATYARPERPATGMRYVLVNGVLAVENGVPTGARAGRALRGPAWVDTVPARPAGGAR